MRFVKTFGLTAAAVIAASASLVSASGVAATGNLYDASGTIDGQAFTDQTVSFLTQYDTSNLSAPGASNGVYSVTNWNQLGDVEVSNTPFLVPNGLEIYNLSSKPGDDENGNLIAGYVYMDIEGSEGNGFVEISTLFGELSSDYTALTNTNGPLAAEPEGEYVGPPLDFSLGVGGNGSLDISSFDGASFQAAPITVPEPAALSILGIGSIGLLARRRRLPKPL